MPPLSTFVVQRVDGEKVWTTANGVAAWCPMSEVVRVYEGINYFTDVIRKGTKVLPLRGERAMIYTELDTTSNTHWPISIRRSNWLPRTPRSTRTGPVFIPFRKTTTTSLPTIPNCSS